MAWLNDPKDSKPSVTLTFTTVSLILLIVACGLEMSGLVKSTSQLFELFGANLAAYVGRRLTWGAKSFGADAPPGGNGS